MFCGIRSSQLEPREFKATHKNAVLLLHDVWKPACSLLPVRVGGRGGFRVSELELIFSLPEPLFPIRAILPLLLGQV